MNGQTPNANTPKTPGTYKVVVVEPSGAVTSREFKTLHDAKSYADEAAEELDAGPVLATVHDIEGKVVHRGEPWWTGGAG